MGRNRDTAVRHSRLMIAIIAAKAASKRPAATLS
jgi:hypothetical protein